MPFKFMSNRKYLIRLSIALLFFAIVTLMAGNTGKITGLITDAKTNTPLVGVNVLVEGTLLGGSTDANGVYFIIGVPPGTYSLKASYIGYQEVIQTDVRVDIDRTIKLPFQMSQTSLNMEDSVVVVAKRKVISLDVSSSKRDISLEDIDKISVSNFNNVLNLQPGTIFHVVTSDAKEEISNELSIRGGTGVGILVDGMNISEAIRSGSTTNFNLSALQASEILTGGFNAEYGNIRSGIINVVTKEGGSRYHFSIDAKRSSIGRKHFGPSIYDTTTALEWIMYGTEEALLGTDGVLDVNDPDSYWEKWAASSEVNTYGFTPEQAQEVWKFQHRPRKYGHKPDYIIDGSFGGPLFSKNVSFFNSLRYEYNMFSVPLSRDHFEDLNWFWKITLRPIKSMKINIQGNYQGNLSSTTYNTSHVSVATAEQAVFSMQYPLTKYYDAMRSIADRYRNQYGINVSHILSSKTFYDLKFSYNLRRSHVTHAPERDTTAALVVGGYSFDSGGQGGWVSSETTQDFGGRESDLGIDSLGFSFILGGHGKERDFSREEVYNLRYDFVSQVTGNNQIKLGIEINYDKMHLITGLIQYPSLVKMNSFKRQPLSISTYIQDKLEFSNMIANLGVRFDYTDRSGIYYTDPFSKYYIVDSLGYAPTAEIKPYYRISPRLGISHPISDKSKLFFNYGHFYDEPGVNQLYALRERESGIYDYIPNANLKPQKTIAYELGFDQQIGRSYLIHFSGFYRDITDQIKWVGYVSNVGTTISSYNNDNYEDIRGFEFLLEKALGTYFIGSVSYDYLVRSSGNVGNELIYESPEKTPVESSHIQYSYPNFNILVNLNFRTPKNFSTLKLLNDWNWNITHEYRDGKYITWNPKNLPGVVYNYHWRPHINTNTRLSKVFKTGPVSTQFYLEVTNVFNRKEMTPYLRSYLLPNLRLYSEYMNSLREGDRPGDYKKSYIELPDAKYFPTQLLFLNPRRFYFGIHFNF